jgi:hypothetical protein
MSSEAIIRDWLREQNYVIKQRPPEPAFVWSFDVANANRQTIYSCLESASVIGQIFLECSVKITDKDRVALAAKTAETREKLLWEIRFGLLNFGLDMSGTVQPLDIVQVRRVVYADGLSKNLFFETAHLVQSGIQFVRWKLLRIHAADMDIAEIEGGLVH